MPRSYLENAFETRLNGGITATDTTITVQSTGSLQAPCKLVIDPTNGAKREYIEVDSAVTATTFVLSATSKRGLAGSASGAQAHSSNTRVWCVPMSQHFDDIWDAIEAAALDADVVKLTGAQTISGVKTFSADPVLSDGNPVPTETANNAAYRGRNGNGFFDVTHATFGASTGAADNRAAIQAAIDAASAAGGGVVFIPTGTYAVTIGATADILVVPSNVTIRGETGTTLRVAGAVASALRIISITGGASNVAVENIKLDGNLAAQGATMEQHHGVFASTASQVRVSGVTVVDFAGDGVFFYNQVRESKVIGCTINGVRRVGINVTGVRSGLVAGNTVRATGSNGIKAETDGGNTGPCEDLAIVGNTLLACGNGIGVTGSATYPAVGVTVTGNTVGQSGNQGITFSLAKRGVISANTVRTPASSGIVLLSGCDYISITGNVVSDDGASGTYGASIQCSGGSGAAFNGLVISGNVVRNPTISGIVVSAIGTNPTLHVSIIGNEITGVTASGQAMRIRSVSHLVVSGNRLEGVGADGIYIEDPLATGVNNEVISDNVLIGFTRAAIRMFGSHGRIAITGNICASTSYTEQGISWRTGSDVTTQLEQHGNVNGGQPLATHAIKPSVTLGTVKWFSAAGTPEAAVTAPVGSLFTRTDGGASTTLYVKETGTGNTGWVAK